jgi:phosphotransferase system enzyme I (PtsP)
LPYFPIKEENPFLGWRGIRVSMDHPEIFIAQVRAMMKASSGLDNLQILLPMISNMNEVDYSLKLIKRAHQELLEEGLNIQLPKVGVMIEIPALMYQIKSLASRIQFISVGTNDLSQYLLAIDRNNPRVSGIYSTLHPSVLRALKKLADDIHAENLRVSVCGEMAGNPGAAVLLMAMGYDVLSMNATSLLKVKSVVRNVTYQQARDLLDKVLTEEDTEAVKALVDIELYNAGVDRLLRTSRNS